MAINWGAVFNTAIDITAAVGSAAMQAAVIDNAVERCRTLDPKALTMSMAREVVTMEDEVWSSWRFRLNLLHIQTRDQTPAFMLQIGDCTRRELRLSSQLMELSIQDAVDVAVERISSLSEYETMCFLVVLLAISEHNLKADMITKRLMKLITG